MKFLFLSVFLFSWAFFSSFSASAEGSASVADPLRSRFEMRDFSLLPILEGGRLKPLDSFARSTLRTYLGKDHLGDQTAIEWLALSLFDPAAATTLPVFSIKDAGLRHRLGLSEKDRPFYSLAELSTGLRDTYPQTKALLEKETTLLSQEDRSFLDLHENAYTYTQILRSFSLILPLDVSVPAPMLKKIGKTEKDKLSYFDLRKIEPDLQQAAKRVLDRKGTDLRRYTEKDSAAVLLAFQMKTLADAAEGNMLLRVIPSSWRDDPDRWHAPWDLLKNGQGSPETAALLAKWQGVATAWQEGDAEQWNQMTRGLSEEVLQSQPAAQSRWRFPLEGAYNLLRPFEASSFLYGGAFLCCFFFFLARHKAFYMAAGTLLALGGVLHFWGLAVRVLILERPPVGTLYESLIFVGLICVALGFAFERQVRHGGGWLIASLSGVLLGLMAENLSGPADTMQVLTAVLNTRFWLATHVLCITFGYGWCVLASFLAHFLLVLSVFGRTEPKVLENLIRILKHIALLALLFTAIGTILGGIWADQSWGRFWGWDPKENGALLIVLWLIWLIHGRLCGKITLLYWLSGLAYLSVVVALAWIGVNLLGVGLHSYGFTESLFWGLGAFSAFETLLVGGLIGVLSQKSGYLGRAS